MFYFSLSLNFQLPILTRDDKEDEKIISKIIDGILELVMERYELFNDILPQLTSNCSETLDRTFFILKNKDSCDEEKYLARYYYLKLFIDSSTNVNDLSSYSNCMERMHDFDFTNSTRKPLKPNYITMFADYRDKLLQYFRDGNYTTNYLIGICFIENCSEKDLKIIFEEILNIINLVKKDEYLNLKIYSLDGDDYRPSPLTIFVKFIPLHIITIHIFIVLFHKIIEYLFKKIKDLCCDTHKSRKIVPRITGLDDSHSNISFNESFGKKKRKEMTKKQHQNCKNYIKALFNIENNFNFLIKTDDKNEIKNDSSLSYMNGIKGISMITFLFGCVYIDLFNSPITKNNVENYYENLSNLTFFLIYFGIKYAPKLLLCSSGFSLFYKFICFLDDKFDSEKALKRVKEEEINTKNNNNEINNETKNNDNLNNNSSYYNSSSSVDSSVKKRRKKYNISFKYYFLFIGSQAHKYILYILVLFFILYSLFDFALFFIDLGPMWTFFNKNMIESSLNFSEIFFSIICFQGYFINSLNKDSILNYFYLVYQEIFYFIISTLIIFLGYKYHLRIDRFLIFIMIILWLFRIIFYFFNDNLSVKEYFSFFGYALFYNSMIYNYIYYALGIYFGCLNYVIQKRYSYYECDRQQKTYLLGFTRLLKIIKKKSKLLFYALGIVFLILIIIFTFDQYLLFKYNVLFTDYEEIRRPLYPILINNFYNDVFISIVMMIDTDIVVLLVNLMALFFYLKGNNYIYDFLNLDFWSIFNKIYFSFILLINPVILYTFYITETRINFNMGNVYLYSFAIGILLFSLVILVYAILELPYKKVIRLYLKRNEIKVGEKALDIMENNSIIAKQMDFKGDLVKSKDNSAIEDDNEEEKENNDNEIKFEEKFIENEKEE